MTHKVDTDLERLNRVFATINWGISIISLTVIICLLIVNGFTNSRLDALNRTKLIQAVIEDSEIEGLVKKELINSIRIKGYVYNNGGGM